MAERVRPNLGESMDDLLGKPWHLREREVDRNPASLISASPLDLALLTPQITCVFDRGFNARNVNGRRSGSDESDQSVGSELVGRTSGAQK